MLTCRDPKWNYLQQVVGAGRRNHALAGTLLDQRVPDVPVSERLERHSHAQVAHKLRAARPPPASQLAHVRPQALLEVHAPVWRHDHPVLYLGALACR
jgi:hypothetical protein